MWNKITLLMIASCLLVGFLWGCGTEEQSRPSATSSAGSHASQTGNAGSVHDTTTHQTPGEFGLLQAMLGHTGQNGGASSELQAEEGSNPFEEESHLGTFQQQVHEAGPQPRDLLLEALNDPDPSIRLIALNSLEPIVRWDALARHSLEQFRAVETNDGIRRRMTDLLANPVDPILQPSAPDAVQN